MEECNLLLEGPLAAKDKTVKANYVRIWAGKTGRTHLKSLNLSIAELGDPQVLLNKLQEWKKPKSNELAAAAAFRRIEQGNLTLGEYIDKATILCDQCNYPNEARDRLLRDAIVIGLRSRDAYFKCIEKGSALTLAQAVEIAENEEATSAQVSYMRPDFNSNATSEVHKLHGKGGGAKPKQQSKPQGKQKPGQSKRKSCFSCGKEPPHPKSECPAREAECFKCRKKGHYGSVCRSKKAANVNEVQAQPVQQYQDCTPGEYSPMYFNASVHQLTTAKILSLNQPRPEPQIRPLWLSQSLSSRVFKIECEVDTGASCNILPLYKAKALFGDNLKLGPPTVDLIGYNDSPVKNLGSCVVFLYHGKETYRILCEVADSRGYMILGRQQALRMNYVKFPEIHKPAIKATAEKTVKQVTTGQDEGSKPVIPVIKRPSRDQITAQGKTHQLPTTKEYLMREYADRFTEIGTLPGGLYHIQLKSDYKPVQHAPRQVAVKLRPAYKAELERLVKLGVITEVTEYTEWINSIVPAKKSDGSLRLCLDPKDLNKAIKRNQWYSRTLDDVLPELAEAKYFSLLDAKSGFWHVPLDHESSMLTTFNTPWGKYRWKRLPFGLKVSGDVFQERLDRVLRSIPNTTGIADDILSHGKDEVEHDAAVISLLETARANNLAFNAKKFTFKSQDCPFFGGHLTSDGYKVDPKKVEAITKMQPPQNLQELQSFLGLVNYLNRFSSTLADLTVPLRALCKKEVVFTWESSQQAAFEAIKKEITSVPVLAYFDQSKKCIIQSDASKKGLGAVLLQDDKPVIYASRSLSDTEQGYSNIERELLSVVFALERFHKYVSGYTITAQTDHLPLVSIWKKSIAASSPRLHNLLLRLAHYDVDIQYLKGKENVVADALSRVSPQPFEARDMNQLDLVPVHMLTEEIPADATSIADFKSATAADTTSSLLMQAVINGWPESRKDCHPLLLDYWTYREEISAENGLLFKGHRLIIPESMRNRCLKTIHEGHFGVEKMQLRAREAVFWPKISADILQTAQSCRVCQTFSKSQQRETLMPHEVPQGPWEKIGIDYFEFQSANYLMIADYYSRFPVIRRTRSTTTSATIDILKQVFSEYGVPKTVMSDNGPQFSSKEFRTFARQYCFDHITSSPRYAQSNGLVERMIQTIKQCLKKCAAAGHDPYLAMLIYRATPLNNSIPAPAELLNGRKYRALLPTRSLQQNAHSQLVREHMLDGKVRSSQQYNQHAKDLPPIPKHQQVLVQVDPNQNKWSPATVTGTPGSHNPRSYSVTTPSGVQLQRNRRFIKPVEDSTQTPAQMTSGENSSQIPAQQMRPGEHSPQIPAQMKQGENSTQIPATQQSRPRRNINKPSRLIETI